MKFLLIFSLTIIAGFPSFSQIQKPINSGDLIQRGIGLYDSGEYKKAIELYTLIDRNDTNYIRSLYERSITYQADSQYSKAMKYCEEGLAIQDQNEYEADLYNSYGSLLNIAGQSDKSLLEYDKGIKKYPSSSLLYFNKGVTLFTMNRYAEAEDVFKQALLINPYQYSAHFYLANAALAQGKIIPAFLSLVCYLSLNPEGKYSARAIHLVDAISRSKDEIVEYKKKSTGETDENFDEVESIVLSKIALEKGYKISVAVDDPIFRQIQVVFEKLNYKENDPDFWMQYYAPFFKDVFAEGHFESFINWSFENVTVQGIKDYNKKNKKSIEAIKSELVEYYNLIRSTRELQFSKRKSILNRFFYSDGNLAGKGVFNNDGKYIGPWTYFYLPGNIKATGQYNDSGERENEWLFYYFSGKLKAKEFYRNGKLEGEQIYFNESGGESSRESYAGGLLNGSKTVYYSSGQIFSTSFYKSGKADGEYREYYADGNISTIKHYNNSLQEGTYNTFYNSGSLKESGSYQNDQVDGMVKEYFENGMLSAEGLIKKGNEEGVWNYYFDNGKLKIKVNLVNNSIEGDYVEYYDNGNIKSSCRYRKGLANGETVVYDKDGIMYARYLFDDDVPKSVHFFDKAGKQISISERKGNEFGIDIFRPQGSLSFHRIIDNKGKKTGLETSYYPSGKIAGTSYFKNGELNGASIVYYLNGRKQSETLMQDGKKEGPYITYYSHGQVQSAGWHTGDLAQGIWYYYDELGNLSTRTYFLNGEISGYKEEFLPNGVKILETKYTGGFIYGLKQYDSTGKMLISDSFPQGTGKYLLVYPNGNKKEEGHYKKGFLNGPYTRYFFDGSVESIQYFKNGLADSVYVSFYFKGPKKTTGGYSFGKKTGSWKVNNEDGSLNYSENYRLDQLDGERNYFYPNGSIEYGFNYKDDERNGLATRYEPDGSVAYSVRYDEGSPVAYTYTGKNGKILPEIPILNESIHLEAFYPNGNPSRECNFADGKVQGMDKLFHGNGHLLSVDSSAYSVTEGAYLKYFPDGKKKSEYFYFHDNPNGLCREFNEKGILQKEICYWNGDLHGTVKYFNADGSLKETRLYYYGTLLSVKYEK